MNRAVLRQARAPLAAFALGAAAVLGFAPVNLALLPVLCAAGLLRLWQAEAAPRRAAALGFAFGLGLFLSGVSWVYISLHDYGDMPAALAAIATLLFCAFLALYPALVGYVQARLAGPFAPRMNMSGSTARGTAGGQRRRVEADSPRTGPWRCPALKWLCCEPKTQWRRLAGC